MTYLTTDHLGTPILAMNAAGVVTWSGGFEPFGADWQVGSANDALSKGIFLRLPGQFDDTIFADSSVGVELYSNVHRWYEPAAGRYASADPLGVTTDIALYRYAFQNPVRNTDPLGLYGTNDCSYYDERCRTCGGDYYCYLAPLACETFGMEPDPDPARDNDYEGWYRCTRQCLQDCDADDFEERKKCDPGLCERLTPGQADPATDEFSDESNQRCHKKCYVVCWVWGTWGHGDPNPSLRGGR